MDYHFYTEQVTTREELMQRVRDDLANNDAVAALWLAGSLLQGGDALSDIDLIAVASSGFEQELVSSISTYMSSVANPVLEHAAPQNAPSAGGHFNVLYDVLPLPLFIDWNIWPASATRARPSDVAVLFERDGVFHAGTKTVAETLADVEMGRPLPSTRDRQRQFRLMMIPVIAKFAARDRYEQVAELFELIDLPGPDNPSLRAVLRLLERNLSTRVASHEVAAVNCIRRYLHTLGSTSAGWWRAPA